jgi:hypothetical protein
MFLCSRRQLKQQVLAAIYNKQHTVSIVLNPRTRHNALQHLAFVGKQYYSLKDTVHISLFSSGLRVPYIAQSVLILETTAGRDNVWQLILLAAVIYQGNTMHLYWAVLAGTYCPHVTHITVHDETPHRGLQSLQLLLPCMTAQLQSLMLHGVHLASRGFQASDLVQHLLQHCPHLRELGLQVRCCKQHLLLWHASQACSSH